MCINPMPTKENTIDASELGAPSVQPTLPFPGFNVGNVDTVARLFQNPAIHVPVAYTTLEQLLPDVVLEAVKQLKSGFTSGALEDGDTDAQVLASKYLSIPGFPEMIRTNIADDNWDYRYTMLPSFDSIAGITTSLNVIRRYTGHAILWVNNRNAYHLRYATQGELYFDELKNIDPTGERTETFREAVYRRLQMIAHLGVFHSSLVVDVALSLNNLMTFAVFLLPVLQQIQECPDREVEILQEAISAKVAGAAAEANRISTQCYMSAAWPKIEAAYRQRFSQAPNAAPKAANK